MVIHLKYGSGLGEGLSSFGASIGAAMKEKMEQTQLQKILSQNDQTTQPNQPPPTNLAEDEGFRNKFLETVQGYENETGEMLNPQELDMAWNSSLKEAQTNQQQQTKGPKQYNMAQLGAIAKKNPVVAKMIQQNQLAQNQMQQTERLAKIKGEQKSQIEQDKRAYKSNEDYLTSIGKLADAIPKREASLLNISQIIGKGDLSTLRNFAADYLGNKGYSADFIRDKNANDLEAAVKTELIADTQSLPGGARLNAYIEQLFKTSLQNPLKSPANNLRITEMQRFLLDVDKEKVRLTKRIVDQYEKSGLEPPANLQLKIDDDLSSFTREKLKGLNQTYKDIDSGKIKARSFLNMEIAKDRTKDVQPNEGFVWMEKDGDPRQVPINDTAKWQKKGARLVR